MGGTAARKASADPARDMTTSEGLHRDIKSANIVLTSRGENRNVLLGGSARHRGIPARRRLSSFREKNESPPPDYGAGLTSSNSAR
jgi:hypothetical protein